MSVSAMAHAAGQRLAALPMDDFDHVKYTRPVGGHDFVIDAWSIQLSLHGGGLSDLDTVFFKFLMEMMWTAYQACIWVIAWFADFAMGLGWLNTIRAPFDTIQEVLQNVLSSYNLYGTMLVITAFVCVIWMARGQWGKGIAELFVALVIVNYAVASVGGTESDSTPVAEYSPLNIMIGQDDRNADQCRENPEIKKCGLVYIARDFGTGVVGQMDGEMEGAESYDPTSPSESIIKTFLFYPVQLVNFGEVLSKECQDAYAIFLWGKSDDDGDPRLGPEEDDHRPWGKDDGGKLNDVIEEHVNEQSAAAGDHVYYDEEGYTIPGACEYDDDNKFENQANLEGILTQWFIGPSVGFLGIVIIVIAGATILAGVNAVVQCFKVLLALLMAILPRGGRRSLWVTIGSALTALLILIFAIIFLGTFMVIIQQIFVQQSGNSFAERIGTFLMIDVMLLIGVIIFVRGRKAVAASKEKMASALAGLTPGGGGGGGGGGFGGGGGTGFFGRARAGLQDSHLAFDTYRDMAGGNQPLRARGGGGIAGGGGGGGGSAGSALARHGIGGLAKAGVRKGLGQAALGFATGGSSLVAKGAMMAGKGGFKAGKKIATSGAARAVGGAVGRGGARFGRAVGNTQLGRSVGRAGTRARGRMQQFGAWTGKGKASMRNKYRQAVHGAGKRGAMPKDIWERGKHKVRRGMTEGAAEMTRGRFGTAGLANRSRAAEGKVIAEESKRNYERRMRSDDAGRKYSAAEANYDAAQQRAKLTARQHKQQAAAERQQRQRERDDWFNNRGQ